MKKSLLAGAYLMSLTGSAYATNASIQCEFALLNQARETLIFCGEKIDPAGERRYDELTKEFQAFIASNADSRPGWQTVEDIRRTLLQEGKERVCIEKLRVPTGIISPGRPGSPVPAEVRSLDAIHLATMKQLGPSLRRLVTYDARMALAAAAMGSRRTRRPDMARKVGHPPTGT